MAINQFLINLIPFIGILVACLGGLYLAQGLLGNTANLLLRIFAFALFFGLAAAAQVLFSPVIAVSYFGIPAAVVTGVNGAITNGVVSFVLDC